MDSRAATPLAKLGTGPLRLGRPCASCPSPGDPHARRVTPASILLAARRVCGFQPRAKCSRHCAVLAHTRDGCRAHMALKQGAQLCRVECVDRVDVLGRQSVGRGLSGLAGKQSGEDQFVLTGEAWED